MLIHIQSLGVFLLSFYFFIFSKLQSILSLDLSSITVDRLKVATASAFPSLPRETTPFPDTNRNASLIFQRDGHMYSKRDVAGGTLLRVMVLGASISAGALSTDFNGFRNHLRIALIAGGNKVNYVGSRDIGSMPDNQTESWGGERIDQMIGRADATLNLLPNIVLVIVGSNDIFQNHIGGMADRMGGLVDAILARVPGTTVIVSTLPPNKDPAVEATTLNYNRDLITTIGSRRSAGKRTFLVDCHSPFFSTADISDATHPNDGGYIKMARVFYDGIRAMSDKIQPAAQSAAAAARDAEDSVLGGADGRGGGTAIDNKCEQGPKTSVTSGVTRTQLEGSGGNDGPYVHSSSSAVTFDAAAMGGGSSEGTHWADLNGDGLDDYVHINKNFDSMTIAFSLGAGKFATNFTINTPTLACDLDGIRFGDLGADGRDDLCCIASNGAVSAWINSGTGNTVTWLSAGFIIGAQVGFPRSRVRLADIDGDGRMDFLGIQDSGNIIALRNGGVGIKPQYWQSIGTVWKGAFAENDGVRLVDLNGDGRADLLYVNSGGQVTTWINNRGVTVGLNPHWVITGTTHAGIVGTNVRNNITFAKIFGNTRNDKIWGAIKSDFVYSYDSGKGVGVMKVWENTGTGGIRLNGDGTRFCDMTGDGSDDYVWISPDGWVSIAVNIHDFPWWKRYASVFPPKNVPRKEIHLADLDGDGKCDILFVSKATGAVTMWRNLGLGADGKFSFVDKGVISGGAAACIQGYGIGPDDLGVRFADLNNDKKADYLCITQDGAISGAINNGLNNFQDVGLIKRSTGADRANVRLADINGDGQADYLWLGKTDGSVYAITNTKRTPGESSEFLWQARGIVSKSHGSRGGTVQFANLKGIGRADYVIVDPVTAKQWTYFNTCPGTIIATPATLPVNPWGPPPAASVPGGNGPTQGPSGIWDPIREVINPVGDTGSDSCGCNTDPTREVAERIWSPGDPWYDISVILDEYVLANEDTNPGLGIDDVISERTGVTVSDCEDYMDNGCNVPPMCPKWDPVTFCDEWDVDFYYLQTSFANFKSLLSKFHNALVFGTIINDLQMGALVDDFADSLARDASGASDILAGIGSALGILGTVLGLGSNPIASGVTGIVGGLIGMLATVPAIADEDTADFIPDTKKVLENRLTAMLIQGQKGLEDTANAIFASGPAGNFDHFSAKSLSFDPTNQKNYGLKTNMARFFADGRYLVSSPPFSEISSDLTTYIQQSLINTILQSSNFYILKNAWTSGYGDELCTGGDACGIACGEAGGIRMDFGDGTFCYTLERPGLDVYDDVCDINARKFWSDPMGNDLMYDKLYLQYGAYISDIVQSAWECQDAIGGYFNPEEHPDHLKMMFTDFVVEGSTYPPCFWNFPILEVKPDQSTETEQSGWLYYPSTPCAVADRSKLPKNLRELFTDRFCGCGV